MVIGSWNITSLTEREVELVEGTEKYKLSILRISETKRKGHGVMDMH